MDGDPLLWGHTEHTLPDIEDLLGPPSDPAATIAEACRSLGLQDTREAPDRLPPGPDVSAIVHELGLDL